jgi:FKBP-type peptidyl-prolyl cis-trans isomerase
MKGQPMKLFKIVIAGLSILLGTSIYAEGNQTMSITTKATATVDKNKMEGEAFLARNKLNKDVVTLPDGLQYKIIIQGKGPKPTDTDVVSVNYAGTFIDGKEFDSSYKRNEPISFPVNGVIAGWTEALKLMPVGSTWMLYIPSELAYGEQGSPPTIPPNTMLIFKVELLAIKK